MYDDYSVVCVLKIVFYSLLSTIHDLKAEMLLIADKSVDLGYALISKPSLDYTYIIQLYLLWCRPIQF